MKWIVNSLSWAKVASVSLAVSTMVMAPVAQGATAKNAAKARVKAVGDGVNYNVNKKSLQEYLKFAGLQGKKRITVGEFYAKMRPYYPATLRRDMDRWVLLNRNEIMPEFETSTYKDREGKEQVRVLISKDGQTVTASFNPQDNAKFVKVNNVFLTKKDIMYHEQAIRKVVAGDKNLKAALQKSPRLNPLKKSVALSYGEFKRLTPRQRAEYFVRLRYVTENAQRVMKSYYGDQAMNEFNKEFFVQWLLGQEAQAKSSVKGAKPGDPCIVSGYMSTYGENYSCGGMASGTKNLKQQMEKFGGGRCAGGSISCNPLVYGYKSDGAAFCVSTASPKTSGGIRDATSNYCPNQSPLRKGTKFEAEDKKRIIESFLASKGQKIDLKFDKDGKVSEDQYNLIKDYLAELNSYIDQATITCQTAPLSSIQTVRAEQASACAALATRKIDLLHYPLAPPLPLPVPEKDCSIEKPGSTVDNGKCVCPPDTTEGTLNEDGRDRPACVAVGIGIGVETKKECARDEKRNEKTGECEPLCGWWCRNNKWVIGGAVIAGIAGAIWWLTRDDDDDDDDNKPVDPCPPAPLICVPDPAPSVSPTVAPPPPIDTSPTPVTEVPTPVVTPYVESTTGTSTSTSGGVR